MDGGFDGLRTISEVPKSTEEIFVGGIPVHTRIKELWTYFAKFGPVAECRMKEDKFTNRFRGFGFVKYKDHLSTERVLSQSHSFKGAQLDVKLAVSKEQNDLKVNDETQRKIFLAHVSKKLSERDIHDYFIKFDDISAIKLNPRGGFAFLLFRSKEGPQRVLDQGNTHSIWGFSVVVSRYDIDNRKASDLQRPNLNIQSELSEKKKMNKKKPKKKIFQPDSNKKINYIEDIQRANITKKPVLEKVCPIDSSQRDARLSQVHQFQPKKMEKSARFKKINHGTNTRNHSLLDHNREIFEGFTLESFFNPSNTNTGCLICKSVDDFIDLNTYELEQKKSLQSKGLAHFKSNLSIKNSGLECISQKGRDQSFNGTREHRQVYSGRPIIKENKLLRQIEDDTPFLFLSLDEMEPSEYH